MIERDLVTQFFLILGIIGLITVVIVLLSAVLVKMLLLIWSE